MKLSQVAWALALPLPLLAAPAATAAARVLDPPWTLKGLEAQVLFNGDLLRDLGMSLSQAPEPDAEGRLRIELRGDGTLLATAPRGIFGTIAAGEVRFVEGPGLTWKGGSLDLCGARLRGGEAEQTLEITDARGELLFTADHMHVGVDQGARRVRLYNLDLRLSPALARNLGEPRHAGLAVAVLEVKAEADIPQGSVERVEGGCVNPDWGPGDVALVGLTSVGQTAYQPGVRVAITPSASLQNVGTKDVPWYDKFSGSFPPYNNDQHPILIWNMYRVAGGAFEQIGASAAKHAFFSTNTGCGCSGGNILWVNCGDTYGTGTNADRFNLGPRSEIVAHTGIWNRCGSIFDPDCDNVQDIPPIIDEFDRRMTVAEADLLTPGAEYYIDSWYVIRDDVNIFNTMGWREVHPVFAGGAWTFQLLTPLAAGAAVDDWVNPSSPGPDADNRLLDTGEGHLKVAMRATDLGGGQWRYDYVVWNFDFDREIHSLSLPLPAGVTATNVGFHDVDNNAATDWIATVAPGSISWQSPSGPASLPWGFVFSFHFEANAAPVSGSPVTATLGILLPPAGSLTTPILGPAMITPVELQRFSVE